MQSFYYFCSQLFMFKIAMYYCYIQVSLSIFKTYNMKKKVHFLTCLLSIVICTENLHAQAGGALDKSFGNGGFVLSNLGTNNNSIGFDVVVQPDGKTVVSGKTQTSANIQSAVLVRYKEDGSFDSSFGTNGIVQESFTNQFDNFSSVALQPNGKFVVSGLSLRHDSSFVLFARYNSNGTLDTAFRNKTNAVNYFGFGAVAIGVKVQPDNKILLMINNNQAGTFAAQTQLFRYNRNGTLDSTFGTNGNFTYTNLWFNNFTQDDKGRIVCVGGDGVTNLLRLRRSGKPDLTFGTNGLATTQLSPYDGPNNVLTQPDGKILVCGGYQAANFIDELFTVARFTETGSLDYTFNGTGVNSTKINGYEFAYDMAFQVPGKLIATGYTSGPKEVYTTLIRYNARTGTIDSTWGLNGIDTVNTTWDNKQISYATASAITPDGLKIVTTGQQTGKSFLKNQFVTARFYLTNPAAAQSVTVNENLVAQVSSTSVFPNPAHDAASISFSLQQNSYVQATLLNAAGQTVANIYNGNLNKGNQLLKVNISNMEAGIYYVVLEADGKKTYSKLVKL